VGLYTFGHCSSPVCDAVDLPPAGITMTSGGAGGVYAAYASAYAQVLTRDIPGLKVQLQNSGGSIDNIQKLTTGTAQLGFISADTAFAVRAQEAGGHAVGHVRAIARIYDEYAQVVVRADGPVKTLGDLRGLRVSVGSPGSSVEVTATRLLKAAGLDARTDIRRRQYNIRDSTAQLRSRQIDAFFWVGGLETAALSDLARVIPLRLVPLGRYVDTLRASYGAVYRAATVPASTYAGVADTPTVAVPSYLLTTTVLSDTLVERLTRSLFTHSTTIADTVPSGRVLDIRAAISTDPIPLHPGAVEYYRSVKP
jgi:TRAP transporter TAXI family solute receptor